MKKLLAILSLALVMAGCTTVDFEKEIADLKAELQYQKAVLESLEQNNTIVDIEQGNGEYTILFSNDTSLTLRDGKTPLVAVGQNGNWTIDGADTGVSTAPQISEVNSVVGVVDGEEEVVFHFSDGTSIAIAKGGSAAAGRTFAERPAKGIENFSVQVNYHLEDNDKTSSGVKQDGELYYKDYGVIALPENYSTDPNKPTRLIILCQGTGERTYANTNPVTADNHGWKYFLAKGYAVMDMNGMAPEWGSAQGFPVQDQHYANKYLLQSYKKGYNYVMEKYNLHKEVFVMGISMGGGASTLIVQHKILPVIAQAGFCPALSVYKNNYMQPWGGTNQARTIAGQYNFPNWKSATLDQQYFLDNYDKVVGYDNLMINTIGSAEMKAQANENYNNDAEREAYMSLSKIYPCPIKIWHAKDDNVVAYRYSEFMIQMIKNAGGNASLRTMVSGGHGGGWNNAKDQISDTDINGKTIKTSLPFYEAMRFIQRYE